jgi:hypothetical protein
MLETTLRMRRSIYVIALAAAGCTVSTGILPVGPNTYTVTEGVNALLGGSIAAQKTALAEANAYCAQQGRQFLAVQMLTVPSANPDGPTRYSVTFRCLLAGDPALTR